MTRLRWDLVACGLRGHVLVSPDAVPPADAAVVHRHDGVLDWYRCVRCDAWLPSAPDGPLPVAPALPDPLPLRGRPLRDRFVLRLIAVDRVLHFLVIGVVAVAAFLVAGHRTTLQRDLTTVLEDVQGSFGGLTRVGVVRELSHLFSLDSGRLYLYAAAIAAYALVNGIEAVGLWTARRWAEYLTVVEVAVFLPFEVRELLGGVTPVKVLAFAINLLLLAYLLWAHRLFGVRGGGRADRAEREADLGWAAVQRATPAAIRS